MTYKQKQSEYSIKCMMIFVNGHEENPIKPSVKPVEPRIGDLTGSTIGPVFKKKNTNVSCVARLLDYSCILRLSGYQIVGS